MPGPGWAGLGVLLLGLAGAAEYRIVRRAEIEVRPHGRGSALDPGVKVGDSVRAEELVDAAGDLRRQLAEHGYLWSAVVVDTSVVDEGWRVLFRVDRGPRARVGGWVLENDDSMAGRHCRLPRRGTRVDPGVLQQAAEACERSYESRGYPLVQVRCVALRESIPFVYPVLDAEPGPRVWLSFVEFAGSPGARPALLSRRARFVPGWFTRASVTAGRRNLQSSGLVRVESVAVTQRDSEYGLRFWVTAGRSNRASAGAGYDPEARRLVGSAQLHAMNLFDTGRRLDAGWYSAYARTGYALSYTEPLVFGTGIDVTGSIGHETEDTSVARTGLALAAAGATRPGPVVFLETGLDFVTDVSAELNARTTWVGTGLRLDTRDDSANPGGGLALSVGTRAGTRTQDTTRAGLVSRTEAGLGAVVPLHGRLVLSGDLVGRAVYSTDELSRYELYELGGVRSLRGYREGEFGSDRTGVLRAELRYLPDRQSRIYPFFDCGALVDHDRWRLVSGWGLGLRAATRGLGVLGVDYGIPLSQSPLKGKVHFLFEASF